MTPDRGPSTDHRRIVWSAKDATTGPSGACGRSIAKIITMSGCRSATGDDAGRSRAKSVNRSGSGRSRPLVAAGRRRPAATVPSRWRNWPVFGSYVARDRGAVDPGRHGHRAVGGRRRETTGEQLPGNGATTAPGGAPFGAGVAGGGGVPAAGGGRAATGCPPTGREYMVVQRHPVIRRMPCAIRLGSIG